MGTSIVQVFQSTLNIILQWISKPQIKKSFKHRRASNGAGQFALSLRKCKYSHYNVWNCKSGGHNKRHSFKRNRIRHKPCLSNTTYDTLRVKGRKGYTSTSPCRQTQMLRANIRCQDDIVYWSTRFKPSLLHFNKFDINNNYVFVNPTYNDHSILNFPLQFTPNHVDSTTNLLDKVVLTEVVMRLMKKPIV